MEQVTEFLGFSDELKLGIENNLFHEICPLSSHEKSFVLFLIHRHPNILLEILTIKHDFHPFTHTVIPFLVNKIAEQILAIPIPPSVNILNIIKFISYCSAVSFSEFIEIKELDFMKVSLDVSFQLLAKNITQNEPFSLWSYFCHYKSNKNI